MFCIHAHHRKTKFHIYYIGVGMTCTLGGLIQYHVQFMCSIIACLIYDQANIGGAIAPPAPMVPTPIHNLYILDLKLYIYTTGLLTYGLSSMRSPPE